MKILCLIDHFGSGGAQRQMVNLACGLKSKGHQVEMFIYYPEFDFFRSIIQKAGIPIHEEPNIGRLPFKIVYSLVRLLREKGFDGIISFLGTPNVYAELASIFSPSTMLIVSERSSYRAGGSRFRMLVHKALNCLADVVVSNSYSQSDWISQSPWLKNKSKTIYNGYPLKFLGLRKERTFYPSLKFLVVSRVGVEKNGLCLVEAMRIFFNKHGYVPDLNWAGKEDISVAGQKYCRKLHELLDNHPEIKNHFVFLGERDDIPQLLKQHRCLILPSLYEGLPNVICEAFIASRPVLASNVCDNSLLVEEGKRGFLFDPTDPQALADTIERFISLTQKEWYQLSINARDYAEEHLSIDRMVNEYETLLLK